MSKRILVLAVCCVWSWPVLAQEGGGAIRVIQPDGTVQEVELPGWGAPKTPEPQAASPVQDTATLPPAREEGASRKSTLDEAIEKAVEQADDVKPEEPKAAKPEKKSAAKDKKKKNKKKKKKSAKPDGPVPAQPEKVGRNLDKPEPRTFPPGTEITPELAKSIALDYAPPARSVEVLPRTYEGKPVYIVRFRTETGLEDVIIDAVNGQPIWTR